MLFVSTLTQKRALSRRNAENNADETIFRLWRACRARRIDQFAVGEGKKRSDEAGLPEKKALIFFTFSLEQNGDGVESIEGEAFLR